MPDVPRIAIGLTALVSAFAVLIGAVFYLNRETEYARGWTCAELPTFGRLVDTGDALPEDSLVPERRVAAEKLYLQNPDVELSIDYPCDPDTVPLEQRRALMVILFRSADAERHVYSLIYTPQGDLGVPFVAKKSGWW